MATYSTITCPATDIGSTMRITINKADSSYWHTLSYTFADYSGNITTGTSANTFDWVVPTGFYNAMPNDKTSTGIMTCVTYNSNTEIVGTYEETFTVRCNEEKCRPTLNPTVIDDNYYGTVDLTGDANVIVLNESRVAFTIGAAARNSATIVHQRVENGNQAVATASGTMDKPTSQYFTFVATDSRGFTTTQVVEVPYIPYFQPTAYFSKEFKINNSASGNGTGSAEIKGTFYNGSFGAVQNKLTVDYYIAPSISGGGSATNPITITPTVNGNEFTATFDLSGFEAGKKYTLRVSYDDEVGGHYISSKVTTPIPIFNWGENDFAFGVPVSVDGDVEISNGDVNLTDNIGGIHLVGEGEDDYISLVRGSKTTGKVEVGRNATSLASTVTETIELTSGTDTTLNVGSDLWITAAESIEITNELGDFWANAAEDLVLDAGNGILLSAPTYIQGHRIRRGTWSPKVYGCSRSDYLGRYILLGDVCVVMWYFTGSSTSYQDEFCIYNLPYDADPDYNWPGSGGGNLSGHFVDTNYVFCGYTMHDDGDIYARTAAVGTEDGQNRTSDYAGVNSGRTVYTGGILMYKISAEEEDAL